MGRRDIRPNAHHSSWYTSKYQKLEQWQALLAAEAAGQAPQEQCPWLEVVVVQGQWFHEQIESGSRVALGQFLWRGHLCQCRIDRLVSTDRSYAYYALSYAAPACLLSRSSDPEDFCTQGRPLLFLSFLSPAPTISRGGYFNQRVYTVQLRRKFFNSGR